MVGDGAIAPGVDATAAMIRIPGGTFRMGSDKHYPEEAPTHRVTVDGFWMDRYPVTNARFREFVEVTGHVTFAELPPNPDDYPGALAKVKKAMDFVHQRQADTMAVVKRLLA